jgi:tRNA(Ile)-lysidine synthase
VQSAVTAITDAVSRTLHGTTGRLFVGYSGGLDSAVLLHAVTASAGAPRVVAVHVNHGLQTQADVWQARCGALARALGVAFIGRRVAVAPSGSREAAARTARYAVFGELLEAPDACLLLAHHRDDQAETVLLRLLQGRGLYGMPAARRLGAGRLLRPLLGVPRSALRAYADRHGLAWVEDPSNLDLTLDRNFLRQQVLPALRERFAGVDTALLAAMHERVAEDALLLKTPGLRFDARSLALAPLLTETPAVQSTWLRLWLTEQGYPLPTQRAVRAFLRQLGAALDRQPTLALQGGELRRFAGRLWLVEPAPALAPSYPLPRAGRLCMPHGQLVVGAATGHSGFAPSGDLVVRFRRGGERLRSGGRQRTLKQLLQAHGVPPWLRGCYPLVFDAAGLAAVPGIAVRDADPGVSAERCAVRWLPSAATACR